MATVVWNLDRLTGYYITVSCGFMRGRRVKRKKKKGSLAKIYDE